MLVGMCMAKAVAASHGLRNDCYHLLVHGSATRDLHFSCTGSGSGAPRRPDLCTNSMDFPLNESHSDDSGCRQNEDFWGFGSQHNI